MLIIIDHEHTGNTRTDERHQPPPPAGAAYSQTMTRRRSAQIRVLRTARHSPHQTTAQIAARAGCHPSTAAKHLRSLRNATTNPNTPPQTLLRLAAATVRVAGQRAARNPNTRPETLRHLAADPDGYVRLGTAFNPAFNTPTRNAPTSRRRPEQRRPGVDGRQPEHPTRNAPTSRRRPEQRRPTTGGHQPEHPTRSATPSRRRHQPRAPPVDRRQPEHPTRNTAAPQPETHAVTPARPVLRTADMLADVPAAPPYLYTTEPTTKSWGLIYDGAHSCVAGVVGVLVRLGV